VPDVVAAFDVATDARPCFRWDGTWNTAEGPQPTCADPGPTVVARAAPQIDSRACSSGVDIRFVGVPWVAPEATGCAAIDRWWAFVPA
jgi:hypothetical protein